METGRESVQAVEAPAAVETPEREVEVVETTEVIEDVPEKTEEPVKNETARETVERIHKELEQKNTGNKDETANGGEKAPASNDPKKPAPLEQTPLDSPEDYIAPARLSLREKEVFNRLPKQLKPAVARLFKDFQAQRTREQQEHSKLTEETRDIVNSIRPVWEEAANRNMTQAQFISGLAAAHKRLSHDDPNVRTKKWLEIGADIELPKAVLQQVQKLLQGGTGNSAAASGNSDNSEILALRGELHELKSKLSKQEQDSLQASVAPVVAEGNAVRNEVDSSGRYLYPELHDPETFNRRVKPLVSAYAEIFPDLTYGELLKKACREIRGDPKGPGNFGGLNQTRLPNGNNNRAQAAAVSVRGRSAPSTNSSSIPENIPDSVRETVLLASENLRRGIA